MKVVHIAPITLSMSTGMGRIACMWQQAFELSGHSFTHIGTDLVPNNLHYNLWGFQAAAYCKRNGICADVWLVHEPAGGYFKSSRSKKLIVYSHGIEQRYWDEKHEWGFNERQSFKSKLMPPLFRFYANNKGFKEADLIFLSNYSDKEWLIRQRISEDKISIFRNGYYPFKIAKAIDKSLIKVLFNATWILRKGTGLVVEVFNKLLKEYHNLQLTLAGTVFPESVVIEHFSIDVRKQIKVIPYFSKEDEQEFYKEHNIFILPSYFEGQSLALTQAMAMGLCPVASNNSGQSDFISNGHNGLLFKTGDEIELMKCLLFCIENPDKVESMGIEAAQSVSKLTWPIVANEVVVWCQDVVENEREI